MIYSNCTTLRPGATYYNPHTQQHEVDPTPTQRQAKRPPSIGTARLAPTDRHVPAAKATEVRPTSGRHLPRVNPGNPRKRRRTGVAAAQAAARTAAQADLKGWRTGSITF